MDCDGDGILDHACSTTVNNNRWLVLSSEGCSSSWGYASRPVSECPQAFEGTMSEKAKEDLDDFNNHMAIQTRLKPVHVTGKIARY